MAGQIETMKSIRKAHDEVFKKQIDKGKFEFSNFKSNKEFFKSLKAGKNKRILEIGSATGYFLDYLHSQGHTNLYGCDVTKVALDYAKKKNKAIDYRLITGKGLPFKSDFFDLVISFDTVEHIHDIKSHFSEVKRILKKGGRYSFSTPQKYVDIIYNIHKIHKLFKGHCSLQTRHSLKKTARELGFENISFTRIPYRITWSLKERVPKAINFTIPAIKSLTEKSFFQPSIFCIMKK